MSAAVQSFGARIAFQTLAPTAQWNGTPESGFGGVNPSAPTDPTRTGAKPVLVPLFVNWITATSNVDIGFLADAKAGLSGGVTFWLEGNSQTVVNPSWNVFQDANGVSQANYGYFITLDIVTALTIANGEAHLYAEAFPADGTMVARVYGPMSIYIYSTEFTQIKTIGPSGADYTTLQAGLQYARLNPTERVKLEIITSGDYPLGAQSSDFTTPKWWTTIEAAPGVIANMGDGSVSATSAKYDGIRFRGSGIVFNVSKLGYGVSGAWAVSSGATQRRLWLDGCEYTTGNSNGLHSITGNGAATLVAGSYPSSSPFGIGATPYPQTNLFATEVNGHDLAAYGYIGFRLVRNCTLTDCSGSGIENCVGAVQQVTVLRNSGISAGVRTYEAATKIAYSGAGTAPQFEKVGANGNAGAFNGYESDVTGYIDSGATATLHVTAVSATAPAITVGSYLAASGLAQGFKVTAVISGSGGVGDYAINTTAGFAGFGSAGSQQTIYPSSHSYQITAMSQVADLVTAIGAWTNWSATTSTTTRAAWYLSLNNNIPSGNIAVTPLSIGVDFQLWTIIDVHGDTLVWSGMTYENVGCEFINVYDSHSFASISNTNTSTILRDVYIGNFSFQDSSTGIGIDVPQPGYNQADWQHHFRRYCTEDGPGWFFGSRFKADSYSGIDHCALGGLSALQSITADCSSANILNVTSVGNLGAGVSLEVGTRIIHSAYPAGTAITGQIDGPSGGTGHYNLSTSPGLVASHSLNALTAGPELSSLALRTTGTGGVIGAAGSNSKTLGGISPASLYVDPTSVPPDLTPLNNGNLQLADLSEAGRYLVTGAEQGAGFPPNTSALIQESGGAILLEDGSPLLLE